MIYGPRARSELYIRNETVGTQTWCWNHCRHKGRRQIIHCQYLTAKFVVIEQVMLEV